MKKNYFAHANMKMINGGIRRSKLELGAGGGQDTKQPKGLQGRDLNIISDSLDHPSNYGISIKDKIDQQPIKKEKLQEDLVLPQDKQKSKEEGNRNRSQPPQAQGRSNKENINDSSEYFTSNLSVKIQTIPKIAVIYKEYFQKKRKQLQDSFLKESQVDIEDLLDNDEVRKVFGEATKSSKVSKRKVMVEDDEEKENEQSFRTHGQEAVECKKTKKPGTDHNQRLKMNKEDVEVSHKIYQDRSNNNNVHIINQDLPITQFGNQNKQQQQYNSSSSSSCPSLFADKSEKIEYSIESDRELIQKSIQHEIFDKHFMDNNFQLIQQEIQQKQQLFAPAWNGAQQQQKKQLQYHNQSISQQQQHYLQNNQLQQQQHHFTNESDQFRMIPTIFEDSFSHKPKRQTTSLPTPASSSQIAQCRPTLHRQSDPIRVQQWTTRQTQGNHSQNQYPFEQRQQYQQQDQNQQLYQCLSRQLEDIDNNEIYNLNQEPLPDQQSALRLTFCEANNGFQDGHKQDQHFLHSSSGIPSQKSYSRCEQQQYQHHLPIRQTQIQGLVLQQQQQKLLQQQSYPCKGDYLFESYQYPIEGQYQVDSPFFPLAQPNNNNNISRAYQ